MSKLSQYRKSLFKADEPPAPIQCSKCGRTSGTHGGTMLKVGDHYKCKDKNLCAIIHMRRPLPKQEVTNGN